MGDWYDTGEGSEHVRRQWGESAKNNPVPHPLYGPKIAKLQAKVKRLQAQLDQYQKVLEHCKDTILYVKQYVSGGGLSAEDDCDDS